MWLNLLLQNGTTFTWAEQHLYGSSRLGLLRPEVSWSSAPPAIPHFASTRLLRYGTKRYEVNDHLGNVRASISDRRQFSSTIFDPAITDATDYFPFGAPNRTVSSTAGYRYGFNGKELDKSNEFGTSNVYDYGFRIYNPSIGRFLSVDPLTRSYPELTPYQFASNTPIWAIDLDGLEAWIVTYNHKPNQAVPSVTWRLDMNREHKKLIYVYHKHWNGEGQMTFMRSNVVPYSEYRNEFPNFSSDDKTPTISRETYMQLIYGEVALPINKVDVEFGVEGILVGKKWINGEAQDLEYLNGSDPELNIGAGVSFGRIGAEFRKSYHPARGEWGDSNVEVDISAFKAAGMKIERNLNTSETTFKFGIPEEKIALRIGGKFGTSISINVPSFNFSTKEKELIFALGIRALQDAMKRTSTK
jgi:RHS repeat-associated protein